MKYPGRGPHRADFEEWLVLCAVRWGRAEELEGVAEHIYIYNLCSRVRSFKLFVMQ